MSKDVMPDLIRHPIYSWVPACAGMTIIVAKVIIYYAFINSLIIVFMMETITISVVFPANALITQRSREGTSAGNQYEEFLDAGLRDCIAILLCHYETPLRRRGNLMD